MIAPRSWYLSKKSLYLANITFVLSIMWKNRLWLFLWLFHKIFVFEKNNSKQLKTFQWKIMCVCVNHSIGRFVFDRFEKSDCVKHATKYMHVKREKIFSNKCTNRYYLAILNRIFNVWQSCLMYEKLFWSMSLSCFFQNLFQRNKNSANFDSMVWEFFNSQKKNSIYKYFHWIKVPEAKMSY